MDKLAVDFRAGSNLDQIVMNIAVDPGSRAQFRAIRDENIAFDSAAQAEARYRDMLHHGMPFVEDAWMAEGWVSYYTELARTRQGHRTEAEGWQALREAFERGRRARRRGTLQEVSDRIHQSVAYQRVYWGGAAIAFFIDIELRVDSGGEVTLDDAMRELRRCCGDAPRKFTAQELLEHLDAWYGRPLFSTIARAHLGGTDFPAVDRGFRALGIGLTDDGVFLDEADPMAPARRDMMAPR